MTSYSELSQQARVWIYQSNRVLTTNEVTFISKKISEFVNNWAAHNRPLKAFAEVRENLFVLFYVDEIESIISGCGIDKSVHLIESIGNELKINFFERMNVVYMSENTPRLASLNELKNLYADGRINDSTIIFNNIIQTKKEVENTWKIALANSWVIKRISNPEKLKIN